VIEVPDEFRTATQKLALEYSWAVMKTVFVAPGTGFAVSPLAPTYH
jgi:hypothetical protein